MKKLLISALAVGMVFALAGCVDGKKITVDEYEEIEAGMSYDEVCDIIGGEGELLSESSIAGYDGAIYSWEGKGSVGANANVTFQNGEVVTKAQIGLK